MVKEQLPLLSKKNMKSKAKPRRNMEGRALKKITYCRKLARAEVKQTLGI